MSLPAVLLSACAMLAILTLGILVHLLRMWQLGNQPISRVQRSTASINHTRHEKCATIYPKCDKCENFRVRLFCLPQFLSISLLRWLNFPVFFLLGWSHVWEGNGRLPYCGIELFFKRYFGNFDFNVQYCGIIQPCGMRFFHPSG